MLTSNDILYKGVRPTMQKAKKYDWKDSNLALFGSDTEKKVCVYFVSELKINKIP